MLVVVVLLLVLVVLPGVYVWWSWLLVVVVVLVVAVVGARGRGAVVGACADARRARPAIVGAGVCAFAGGCYCSFLV